MFAKVNDETTVHRSLPWPGGGLPRKLMSNARQFEKSSTRRPLKFISAAAGLLLGTGAALAANYQPEGTQYLAAGAAVGDQVLPVSAFHATGGWLVWQDNSTDGLGSGISARRLTGQLTGLSSFRVNETLEGDQENAQIGLLPDGAAFIVWQSGQASSQSIVGRIVRADGRFAGPEFVISQGSSDNREPAIAVNRDGTVLIVWGAEGVDGDMQGVQGRRYSVNGTPLGDAFVVNQSTRYHQRSAAVTALDNGSFAVAWVSENQRGVNSVDIYGRYVAASGDLVRDEFLLNVSQRVCATPALSALPGAGFLAAWGEHDNQSQGALWDVYSRVVSPTGPKGSPTLVNIRRDGFQGLPKLANAGDAVLAVYRSAEGDGVGYGIVGQWLGLDGTRLGPEFVVNTQVHGDQLHPSAASDGNGRVLVTWSTFQGISRGMDIAGQRYGRAEAPLTAPSAPYVFALSSSRLQVTWAELTGLSVQTYEVYVDGGATPVVSTTPVITLSGLAPESSHSVQLAYVLEDGRRSPRSAVVTGVTWGEDDNADGLPDDWQTLHFGANSSAWPSTSIDSDGDGVSDREEFLAGTDPRSASSVLKTSLTATPQGVLLSWNSRPGGFYQAQYSINLKEWVNIGNARLAGGSTDSIPVGDLPNNAYYRVNLLR